MRRLRVKVPSHRRHPPRRIHPILIINNDLVKWAQRQHPPQSLREIYDDINQSVTTYYPDCRSCAILVSPLAALARRWPDRMPGDAVYDRAYRWYERWSDHDFYDHYGWDPHEICD